MNPKLTAERLARGAAVYIRQSTPGQVLHHQESQRRQYALQEQAQQLGFQRVEVIDEDLGCSGSGLVARSGFQRLVAAVCAGTLGAIFCIEASRLARNGREWHALIDLCGLQGTVIVDPDGTYDPGLLNDRLLLGLKGTMSEFELNLLRQRSAEAIRQKAQRGELRFQLPIGYVWTAVGRVEKDPDQRVQQALALVFAKMMELGSVRQVLLWFRREGLSLPRRSADAPGSTVWAAPIYNVLRSMVSNPMYGGAYAFGKTQSRTTVQDGRAGKTVGHRKPRSEWTVLLLEHHPGYISWEQYERHQAMLAGNTHMRSQMQAQAGRGGRGLLSGMLRCRRCGRMLYVSYSGSHGQVLRYRCGGAHQRTGEPRCITFSGRLADQAVGGEVLLAIGGNAVEAAVAAAESMRQACQEQRRALELELEQARYEVQLAVRRYESVDPGHRLVVAELEARWDAAMRKAQELEERLRVFDDSGNLPAVPDKEILMSLAQDLPAVWESPATAAGLKQRIVRILVEEVVADVDEEKQEVVLLIHWAGGRHSELRVRKPGTGQHARATGVEAIEVIRQMSGRFGDGEIAATLNRLRLRTGAGNSWNAQRVYGMRRQHELPNAVSQADNQMVTLQQAAGRLGVSEREVKRLIEGKVLAAKQAVACAPWEISLEALDSPAVQGAMERVRTRKRPPTVRHAESGHLFSES